MFKKFKSLFGGDKDKKATPKKDEPKKEEPKKEESKPQAEEPIKVDLTYKAAMKLSSSTHFEPQEKGLDADDLDDLDEAGEEEAYREAMAKLKRSRSQRKISESSQDLSINEEPEGKSVDGWPQHEHQKWQRAALRFHRPVTKSYILPASEAGVPPSSLLEWPEKDHDAWQRDVLSQLSLSAIPSADVVAPTSTTENRDARQRQALAPLPTTVKTTGTLSRNLATMQREVPASVSFKTTGDLAAGMSTMQRTRATPSASVGFHSAPYTGSDRVSDTGSMSANLSSFQRAKSSPATTADLAVGLSDFGRGHSQGRRELSGVSNNSSTPAQVDPKWKQLEQQQLSFMSRLKALTARVDAIESGASTGSLKSRQESQINRLHSMLARLDAIDSNTRVTSHSSTAELQESNLARLRSMQLRLDLVTGERSSASTPLALKQERSLQTLRSMKARLERLNSSAPSTTTTDSVQTSRKTNNQKEIVVDIEKDLLNKDTDVQKRLRSVCNEMGLTDTKFKRTPMDYYEWTLEKRRAYLGAKTKHQLCKTIIMHNTRLEGDGSDPTNSKYYAIIVQYTTKTKKEKLQQFVRGLKPMKERLSKSKFNFRLCPEDVNAELSGFGHNAVTPVGMKAKIPMIISDKIVKLCKDEGVTMWLGGGEVDVKWEVKIDDFLKAFKPFVGDIANSKEVE